jgi:hypothetical protein
VRLRVRRNLDPQRDDEPGEQHTWLLHSAYLVTLLQVSARQTRHGASRHSRHTCPHSCSTHRCYSRGRFCTLRRVVNFLLRRPFFAFIALDLRNSCSDADVDRIVVMRMKRSVYTRNSIAAAASLIMVQCRLDNFPVFSLIFPLLSSPPLLSLHLLPWPPS